MTKHMKTINHAGTHRIDSYLLFELVHSMSRNLISFGIDINLDIYRVCVSWFNLMCRLFIINDIFLSIELTMLTCAEIWIHFVNFRIFNSIQRLAIIIFPIPIKWKTPHFTVTTSSNYVEQIFPHNKNFQNIRRLSSLL